MGPNQADEADRTDKCDGNGGEQGDQDKRFQPQSPNGDAEAGGLRLTEPKRCQLLATMQEYRQGQA